MVVWERSIALTRPRFVATALLTTGSRDVRAFEPCQNFGPECDCEYEEEYLADVLCSYFPDYADEFSFCNAVASACDWGINGCFCGTFTCHGYCYLPPR
jgi:hypothetical protein